MLEHRDAFRDIFSLFTIGLYFVGLGINPDAAKNSNDGKSVSFPKCYIKTSQKTSHKKLHIRQIIFS